MERPQYKLTAIAGKRKAKNKRSAMLRMIMPLLSRETGDKLADAIEQRDSASFRSIWNEVRKEVEHKLDNSRKK